MLSSIGKRLWNSPLATTWTATAAQLMSLVLVIPLILGRFPAEEVEFWLMLNSLLILSLLVEVGFTSTFGRLYSFAMAGKGPGELGIQGASIPIKKKDPNWETIHSLNGVGQRIFLVLTGIYFLILFSFGSWVVGDVIDGLENPILGWAAWFVMAASQPLAFLGKKYGCYLSGTGLIAMDQRYAAVISLVSTLAMVSSLLLGGGIFTVILVGQLTSLLSLFRARFLALRARPGRYNDSLFGTFSPEIWSVAWPTAWKSAIGLISLTGATHISVLLYSKSVDALEGSSYLLALKLISMVSQIANAPLYSKLPILGRLRGSGDLPGLVRLAKKGMSLATLTFVLGVLALALVGPQIFELFKREVGFPPTGLWLMFGLAILFQRIGAMHLQLYTTTNHIVWHWVNGVTGIIFITLLLILMPKIGGMALPISLAIAYLALYMPWCTFLSLRSIKQGFWEFERAVSLPAVCLGVSSGIVIYLYG